MKGKTWGPSTVHQRERGHLLPAMRETSVRTPTFSKSAPNLDKSRAQQTSASTPHSSSSTLSYQQQQQQHHHQSSSGRLNVLGKSVDGLATNGSRATGSGKYEFERFVEDDDDDDEDRQVKGCFPFIRSDDGYARRKKYSLDSKMDEQHQNKDDARVPTIAPIASLVSHGLTLAANVIDADKIDCRDETYDRKFYHGIQKSLEEIYARDDFVSQRARNSKSSGDLTQYDDETCHSYEFQRYGSGSQFDRECFLVHHGESADEEDADDSEAERNRSDKSNASFQDADLSQTSTDSPLDTSFASVSLNGNSFNENSKQYSNRSFDERSNSMCSDQSSIDLSVAAPSSASRKSSVTFRVDDMFRGAAGHQSDTVSYRSDADGNANITVADVSAQFLPSVNERSAVIGQQATPPHYHHMKPIRMLNGSGGGVGTLKSALARKDKPSKSKFNGIKQFLKRRRGNALLHSNSFYNKLDNKTDLSEQLLDDDQSNAISAVEPQYEAIYTRRFVLAKQNEK